MFNTNQIQMNKDLLQVELLDRVQTSIENQIYSYEIEEIEDIFNEDDVWKTFPSENDKFAGWAKRMGELQIEAYKTSIQTGSSLNEDFVFELK